MMVATIMVGINWAEPRENPQQAIGYWQSYKHMTKEEASMS